MNREARTTTPRLRFPEFRGAEEWKERKLGDCLDYQQPTAYLISDTNYHDSYGIPVLTAGKTFILGYTNEEEGVFERGLPAIIFDDFTTASQFVDFPFKAKSSAMKILQAKTGADVKFLYEALQMISYEPGTHKRHWISTFAPMSILVPQHPEQQKIADCLTSLDDVIAAQARKVEALKEHKRGLMQQLFPREGETRPRLRFPEFRKEIPWVERRLKEFCIVNPSSGDLPDSFIYIDLESVVGGVLRTGHHIKKNNAPSRAQRLLRAGDIIFQMVRPYQKNNLFIQFDDTEYYVASTGYAQLRSDKSKKFLYQLIHTDQFVNSVLQKCTGSSYPAINSSDLADLVILAPKDTHEQQKIADCLTSLDDVISAQARKMEALKEHKHGLMQQLFPAPEAIGA